MIQLTLTLKMTSAQVVETSVTVNNNSPIQDYVHPDDQTQPTFKSSFLEIFIITGLKSDTILSVVDRNVAIFTTRQAKTRSEFQVSQGKL